MRKGDSTNEKNQKEAKPRAKYSCPPDLEKIITEVNIIQPEVKLLDWNETYNEFEKSYSEGFRTKYTHPQVAWSVEHSIDFDKLTLDEQREIYHKLQLKNFEEIGFPFFERIAPFEFTDGLFIQTFKVCIKPYPALENLIFKKAQEEEEGSINWLALPFNVETAYIQFTEKRRLIRKLVEYFSARLLYLDKPNEVTYQHILDIVFLENEIAKYAEVVFNPFGAECFQFTGLAKTLNGVSEIDRLRACEICQKIFWAKNKKSRTCSPKCLNIFRQRKHREKNKEEINAKRRATYQSKKEQKEGSKRRRNNGAL